MKISFKEEDARIIFAADRARRRRLRRIYRICFVIAMLPIGILLACMAGCTTDLQRDYYETVEAYRLAIEADVTAGIYRVDSQSRATLDDFASTQGSAKEALRAAGK